MSHDPTKWQEGAAGYLPKDAGRAEIVEAVLVRSPDRPLDARHQEHPADVIQDAARATR